MNYNGLTPSSLKHKQYEVYGMNTQVNQSQIDPLCEGLKHIVDCID